MKSIFTLTAILFFSLLHAQNVSLVWAKNMGGTSADYGNSLAVDASGNVYTTGYFVGTADFDPGAGTFNLTSAGGSDIFVSKLDAAGNFAWAKSMGGTDTEIGYSIAIDASGNVFTTGYFRSTADFDPGTGTFNLTSAGSNDIFVSKLDASGNFVWAKNMGGTSADFANSIAVDAAGNVYTIGNFRGTADFDPGAGTFNLTSAGGDDIFESKLDASGNFVWAKKMGSTINDAGRSITVDASGNVYTTGYFQGTVDFDPGAGTVNLTSGGQDIYVSKVDASGNFAWAKNMGGTLADEGRSIAVDASGNVYTTGYFQGTVDFDPGAGTVNLTSAGGIEIFVSKLDASGNFVWAKNMGSSTNDIGYSIAVDASGNVYTTGYFTGTADFDPGAGIFNLTSGVNADIFVSKLDASGNFVWANRMGASLGDIGYSIAADASGNVYTTGYFTGIADFDPGAGTVNLTSAGQEDIFVVMLSQGAVLPVTFISISATQKNTGNQLTWKMADEQGVIKYDLYRSANAANFTKVHTLPATPGTNGLYNWLDAAAPAGLAFYRVAGVTYDGRLTYSAVAKTGSVNANSAISIAPNPVQGRQVNLQFTNEEKGDYIIRIVNNSGGLLQQSKIAHAGGNASYPIVLPATLAKGIYQLEIIKNDKSRHVQKLVFAEN